MDDVQGHKGVGLNELDRCTRGNALHDGTLRVLIQPGELLAVLSWEWLIIYL